MNRNVLIVDDQEDLRLQVAKLLEQDRSANETSSLIDQIRSRISKPGKSTNGSSTAIHYAVDTVGQGRDAYDKVKQSFAANTPYALMFLDMRMPPGWDGLETAQRIRSIDKEIEIVIMTAYADYDQREIAEKIGEPDKLLYVKKPFHPEEIRQLALALTEKWNMNRREKERLILTNRLMRENANLTRRVHKHLGDTSRSILDAYVSFLDAQSGIVVRRLNNRMDICAATSPDDEVRLIKRLPKKYKTLDRMKTTDANGSGFFPIVFEGFDGFVYLEGKNITFPFDQLRPFLDILTETAREVLKNATLIQEQAEERKLAAVGMAMGRIATEMESTLEIVSGYTSQLRDCSDDHERSALCQALDEATQQTLNFSHDILEFGRGHKQVLECKTLNVSDMLNEIHGSLDEICRKENVEINTSAEPTLTISCDPRLFKRAVVNIVRNAVQATTRNTAQTQRRVEVNATLNDDDDHLINITVRDSGPGVPDTVAAEIFEPFVADGDASGHGLGTTIARQIVEQHRGHISFHSVPDVGTSFVITVPISPDHPPASDIHLH